MTALVALGPLAFTPILVLLLMQFGPERSVLFALYWVVMAIVFAIVTPLSRRRGQTLGKAARRGAVWAVSSMIAAFVVLFALSFGFAARARAMPVGPSSPATQRGDTAVKIPAVGSVTRKAILDAVRAHYGVSSRFRVTFVRSSDRWAFVRCVEVVEDAGNLQETDLDVAALLERRSTPRGTRWQLVEQWALATDQERPYTPFARRVRQRVRDAGLPAALFPPGFLRSDVPVE